MSVSEDIVLDKSRELVPFIRREIKGGILPPVS